MDIFRTFLLLFGMALGGLLTTMWTYLPHLRNDQHLNALRPLVPKSSLLRKTPTTTTTTTTTTCNCNGNRQGGYWELTHSNWVTPAENDPRCQTIQPFPCIRLQTISKNDLMPPATTQILDQSTTYNAERVVNCLTSHRRIVLMGDSVHRGLFWSLVHAIEKSIESAPLSSFLSQLNTTVVKNFNPSSKGFTNFQDQDFYVRDTNKNNQVLFSIRFVYSSNSIDFPARCKLIHDWFFQCLQTAEDILHMLFKEEQERYVAHEHAPGTTPPVGVLYWNTGLWDWRTGLSSEEYEHGLSKVIRLIESFQSSSAKNTNAFAAHVVWRTTSASWPTKFMNDAECQKKPHGNVDSRPCSVHTSDIVDYNTLALRQMSNNTAWKIVDSFPITNGRPDLSFDGLHFEPRHVCQHRTLRKDGTKEMKSCVEDVDQIYLHLNDMFLNSICPA